MDVMLRFGQRSDSLEKALKSVGHDIIYPYPRNKTVPVSECFQIVLCPISEGVPFEEVVADAARALDRIGPHLMAGRRDCEEKLDMELDFGISVKREPSITNHRFSPRLLERLARLDIELNVSIYA